MPILDKLFKKIQKEETLLNLLYEAIITLSKLAKLLHEKKSTAEYFFKNNTKILSKTLKI